MRGEQLASAPQASRVGGSSPRARGTVAVVLKSRTIERFIPACAGNSEFVGSYILNAPVHPRVRGEQADATQPAAARYGSSPRAREAIAQRSKKGIDPEGERSEPAPTNSPDTPGSRMERIEALRMHDVCQLSPNSKLSCSMTFALPSDLD